MFVNCDKCPERYLQNPLVIHNCSSILKCANCGHDCPSKSIYDLHTYNEGCPALTIKSKKSYARPTILCEACGKSYVKKNGHKCGIKKIVCNCPDCGLGFSRKSSLSHHQVTQVCKVVKKCTACKKDFSEAKTFILHLSQCSLFNQGKKRSACHKCGNSYSSKKTHICNANYECEYCGDSFNNNEMYSFHTSIQKCKKIKGCSRCNTTFKSVGYFLTHIKTCNPEEYDLCMKHCAKCDVKYRKDMDHKCGNTNVCNDCGSVFDTLNLLTTHRDFQSCKQTRECPYCKSDFQHSSQLKIHIAKCPIRKNPHKISTCGNCGKKHREGVSHHCNSSFNCDNCGESFDNEDIQFKHELFQYCKLRKSCPGCKRKFTYSNTLEIHCNKCPSFNQKYSNVFAHHNPSVLDDAIPNSEESQSLISCTVCISQFKSKKGYQNHYAQMHKVIQCVKCDKTFVKGTIHNCGTDASCTDCDQCFSKYEDLQKHVSEQICKKIKMCNQCGKQFTTQLKFRKHLNICAIDIASKTMQNATSQAKIKNSTAKMQCMECRVVFDDQSDLDWHKLIQSCKPIKQCIGCDINLTDTNAFNLHLNECFAFNQLQLKNVKHCKKCLRNYGNIVSPKHLPKHICDTPFVCKDCGIGFINHDNLRIHTTIQNCKMVKKCFTCLNTFRTYPILWHHLKTCNYKEFEDCLATCVKCKSTYRKDLQHKCKYLAACSNCGAGFKTKGLLQNHTRKQLCKSIKVCPYCKSEYKTSGRFTVHLSKCSLAIEPFEDNPNNVCKICGEISRVGVSHTCNSKYRCTNCGGCFGKQSEFLQHKRNQVCKSVKVCRFCSASFNESTPFVKHIRICKFTQKSKIRIRKSRHICRLCGKRCGNKSGFNYHCNMQICKIYKQCIRCSKRFRELKMFISHTAKCRSNIFNIIMKRCEKCKSAYRRDLQHICKDPLIKIAYHRRRRYDRRNYFGRRNVPKDKISTIKRNYKASTSNIETFTNLYKTRRNKQIEKNADLYGRCCYCQKPCYESKLESHLAECKIRTSIIEPLACQFCETKFSSSQSLYRHQNMHCNRSDKRKGYVCGDCSFISVDRCIAILHGENAHKKKIFANNMKIVNGFGCYACGLLFGNDEETARYHAKSCSIIFGSRYFTLKLQKIDM